MKIKITRGNSSKGDLFAIQNDEGLDPYQATAKLCGLQAQVNTYQAHPSTIFTDSSWFYLGTKSCNFVWDDGLNPKEDAPEVIQEKLKARIAEVRTWVAKNTWIEEFSFEL